MPTDNDRPRRLKKKKKAPESKLVLYLALGGCAAFVVLCIGLVVLFSRLPTPGPRLETAGINLDELPVWTADKGSSLELDANAQPIGAVRMKLISQLDPDPGNATNFQLMRFTNRFGNFTVQWLSSKTFGFDPGQKGPKDILEERLRGSNDPYIQKAADRIEMGRSGNLVVARCKIMDRKPHPMVYWSAMLDTHNVLVQAEIDSKLGASGRDVVIKVYDASMLSIQK